MVSKTSLSPFVGKAKVHAHKGKGSLQSGGQKPSREDVAAVTKGNPAASINDYAKQTPMAQAPTPVGPPGLGTGAFTGFGS